MADRVSRPDCISKKVIRSYDMDVMEGSGEIR